MATPRISGWKPVYGLCFGIPLGLIEALLIPVSAQSIGFPLAVTAGLLLYLVVPLGSSLLFSRRARVARRGYTVGVVTGISGAVTAVLATVIYGYLALVTAPVQPTPHPMIGISSSVVIAIFFCLIIGYHLIGIMLVLAGAFIGSARYGKTSPD